MRARGCPVMPCSPQKQTDPRAGSNPGVRGAVWGLATCRGVGGMWCRVHPGVPHAVGDIQ